MLEHVTEKLLINDANTKSSESLKKNYLAGANVAQVLVSAGNEKLQETSLYKVAGSVICANAKCYREI